MRSKYIFTLLLLLCAFTGVYGQTYNMSNTPISTCSGVFYDDGGPGGNYNDYVSHNQTFTSGNGNRIQFVFTSFSTSTNADVLYIYDGPSNAYPLIGAYAISGSPGTVTSTGTSLTFVFVTNGLGSSTAGWAANISCTTAPLTVYNMSSGTTTACSGVFYDNGGATANYPDNENRVHTFCSGTTDNLQFVFNQATFGLSGNDSLFIYDGASTSAQPIAVYTAGSIAETVTSTGTCITFLFKSDGTTNASGWQAAFSCTSTPPPGTSYSMSTGIRYTCGGSFYDSGGSSGNYNDYIDHTQTFYSNNGNRLQFSFTSFNTSTNADVLYIYDGPSNAYPLIGIYTISGSPGTVTSTGTSLTFVFVTNGAGSSTAGWAASISCTTPALNVYNMNTGTTTACSGVFYDNGGSNANYPNNENRIHTFCSGTSDYLQFTFNQAAYGLSGNDSLFIYDGASTSAQPIAVYTAGSIAETVTSTGTCITFLFKSDGTTNASGWQAVFNCTSTQPPATSYSMSTGIRYTCGGSFYDSGGSGGNYNDYIDHTQTFYSNNGNRLQFTFTSLNTSTNADVLYIYDGPSNAYPLIGVYTVSSSPGTVTSTGTSLTFVFVTNGLGTSTAGWAASISCTTPPLTVYNMNAGTTTACSGVFYDNGGANANYPNNENRVQTFCSDNGQFMQFVFNQAAYSLSGNDSLFIYDGASTSAQPIAVYTAGSIAETVTSTGTCITFRFKSDGTTNASGWQAVFSCTPVQPSATSYSMSTGIRYTCGGSFYDSGGPSGNYNDYINHVQTFVSTGGCALRATFTSFNTSTSSDYLRIYDGPSTASPLIGTYSVSSNPGLVQASGSALTFQFVTNGLGSSTAGWAATFSCPTQTVPPVVSTNSPLCEGDTLQLTSNNIPGGTYSWSGPNGFSSTLQNPSIPNVSLAASGTYTVTATVGGCTSNQTITIVAIDALPSAPVATNNGPICSSSSLNLSATPVTGATYSWTGPNGFTSTQQNPSIAGASTLASGIYTITAAVGACAVQDTTVATVTQTPGSPTVSSNSPLCTGNTLMLSAVSSGAASYSWTGPNGFTSTQQNPSIANVTLAEAGTYTVTAVNGSCTSQATVTVSVSNAPSAPTASSNAPVCEGAALNLSASAVAGASYSWSGPNAFSSMQQNPSISNVTLAAAGTYTVTATAGGCSVQSTVTVTIDPVPAAPAAGSNSPVCSGSTINLTASAISGATYSWTGLNGFTSSQQNPSITNAGFADAGTYTVTATVNGCTSAPATVSVTVNTVAPVASASGTVCEGSTVSFGATTIAGATYSWSGPNGFASSQQNPSIINATASASGTYTVTATIGSCVSQPSTVMVTVNPVPAAPVATNNGPVCSGSPLSLSATTIAGATYSWSGPNGFTSSQQNPVISSPSSSASGTYSVTATVNGCTSSAGTTSVTVSSGPAAPTASSNAPLCEGATLQLNASNVSNATYSWTGPNGFTSSLQAPSIPNVTAAASGTYSVTVTANGCSSTAATVQVTIDPAPAPPVITWDQNLQLLSSSYMFDIQWYLNGSPLPGETFSDLYYPMYSNTGPYTVVYTDANGCSSTSAPFTFTSTGIAGVQGGIGLDVYPNPNNGEFTIDLVVPGEEAYTITLTDALGRKVSVEEVLVQQGTYKNTFTGDLAKGVYTLTVRSGTVVAVKKIVVQ